jgi:hypothetical protein
VILHFMVDHQRRPWESFGFHAAFDAQKMPQEVA